MAAASITALGCVRFIQQPAKPAVLPLICLVTCSDATPRDSKKDFIVEDRTTTPDSDEVHLYQSLDQHGQDRSRMYADTARWRLGRRRVWVSDLARSHRDFQAMTPKQALRNWCPTNHPCGLGWRHWELISE